MEQREVEIDLIDFLFDVRPLGEQLVNMLEAGELPLRDT